MYDVFSSVYGSYKGTDMSENLLIELQDKSISQRRDRVKTKTAVVCIYFLRGNCTLREDCKNSHSSSTLRPLCHFYSRPGGCTNSRCVYSHVEPVSIEESFHHDSMMDPIHAQFEGGPLAGFECTPLYFCCLEKELFVFPCTQATPSNTSNSINT